tara:strand:- start:66 stop:485 length:420 start_codon:yes stop_codon:yes gene_type:complete
MHQKTQETSTLDLIKCSQFFKDAIINSEKIEVENIKNCRLENLENIYSELYSRLVKPLYITFLILISLLFILKSKNDHTFNINKFKIFSFAFVFIVFLESSSKLISTNLMQNLIFSIFPLIITIIIYLYFLIKLKTNNT